MDGPAYRTRDLATELKRGKSDPARRRLQIGSGTSKASPVDDALVDELRRARPATPDEARLRAAALIAAQRPANGSGDPAQRRARQRLDAFDRPPKDKGELHKAGEVARRWGGVWRALRSTSQPPGSSDDWQLVWQTSR